MKNNLIISCMVSAFFGGDGSIPYSYTDKAFLIFPEDGNAENDLLKLFYLRKQLFPEIKKPEEPIPRLFIY